MSIKAIMSAMGHDKKGVGGTIRFVFQKGIGELIVFEGGAYARPVDAEVIREFLEEQPRG